MDSQGGWYSVGATISLSLNASSPVSCEHRATNIEGETSRRGKKLGKSACTLSNPERAVPSMMCRDARQSTLNMRVASAASVLRLHLFAAAAL